MPDTLGRNLAPEVDAQRLVHAIGVRLRQRPPRESAKLARVRDAGVHRAETFRVQAARDPAAAALGRRVAAGLCIGRDGGAGVTTDYPGKQPWPFTGGTIRRVAVDVSGEAYIDLEREAAAMLMRE